MLVVLVGMVQPLPLALRGSVVYLNVTTHIIQQPLDFQTHTAMPMKRDVTLHIVLLPFPLHQF